MGTSEPAARRNVHEGLKKLRGVPGMNDPFAPELNAASGHLPARRRARASSTSSMTRWRARGVRCWAPPASAAWSSCCSRRTTRRRARAAGGARLPRILRGPGRLEATRRELGEYFEGRRRNFEVGIDWEQVLRGFGRKVLEFTNQIPYGEVRTYTQVATAAGSPAASRAAGNALGANPIPIIVPCHRVVRTGGALGGYGGGLPRKAWLLALEQSRG